MRHISNTPGPLSYGETSWEAGGIGEVSSGKTLSQELIKKANTVPLSSIFLHYNLRIDPYNMNRCPFKSHKGGGENTPSFKFYKKTNSFFCYGCNQGHENAHACEFVAAFEEITKDKAAAKILKNFPGQVITTTTTSDDEDSDDFSEEKMETIMDFSTTVREFRVHHFDEKSEAFIEDKCLQFDNLVKAHPLDAAALCRVVDILKHVIASYTD